MGRLLRTHLPQLALLEGFDARWDVLLGFVQSSILEGSREVALAAVGSLVTILQAHAGTPAMPRPLWKRALRVYVYAARGANRKGSGVALKTRAELVSALGRLYQAKRQAFDEADMRSLLALLDMLAR